MLSMHCSRRLLPGLVFSCPCTNSALFNKARYPAIYYAKRLHLPHHRFTCRLKTTYQRIIIIKQIAHMKQKPGNCTRKMQSGIPVHVTNTAALDKIIHNLGCNVLTFPQRPTPQSCLYRCFPSYNIQCLRFYAKFLVVAIRP